MRVALAHYSSEADISGVTSWLVGLVARLKADGFEPHVHLHHLGRKPSQASILALLRDAGVVFDVVPCGRNLRQDVGKTLRFLERVQPSVFLPQCLSAHFAAAAIAGTRGLPWVFTMHSDDPDYWMQIHAVRGIRGSRRTVCVSRYLAARVIEQGFDDRAVVIPCGVPLPEGPVRWPEGADEAFHVVYVGRVVERQKRMSLVVDALVEACRMNARIRASIIGDGPARAQGEQCVSDAGLGHRIVFLGRLPREAVDTCLRRAHACLLMSDFEGLPVALLEAMAFGVVPVVRASESGIPELIREDRTGITCDANPRTAATALSRLSLDESLWRRCSRGARELVANSYTEDASYGQWRRLIDELAVENAAVAPFYDRVALKSLLSNRELVRSHHPRPAVWKRVAWRLGLPAVLGRTRL
jgi:colanic acid/amylovoran biosynthesis glycosyltransferase